MNVRNVLVWLVMAMFMVCGGAAFAADPESPLEKDMSASLDVWREGKYEQLFEQLAHRGKTSKETFAKKMRETTIRPACCWQKMENFKVLNEKRTEATVYVKIGLEGTPNAAESVTREFKLTHQDGEWKMQLADVMSIARASGKKTATKHHSRKNSSKKL
jgi:dTDP-4-amino-4,6-dideoxygalactose transaminase